MNFRFVRFCKSPDSKIECLPTGLFALASDLPSLNYFQKHQRAKDGGEKRAERPRPKR